jgi:hypothetical protein
MPDKPQQAGPLKFELFAGVNTATTRPGVPDEQAYWLDGFMPLAPRNLRTLYGIGEALYTATGKTIVCFYFYNIGAVPYCAVFLSDGSLIQVNTQTGATSTILASGSILNPSITQMGITQYGQQYLVAVANQTNGYWIWDGSLIYSAGSLAPIVTLTEVGAGYVSIPTVTATGGHGFGATFVASINNGVVTNVAITNPGFGYLGGDTVSLVFTGGLQAGSGASVAAILSDQVGGSGASISLIYSLSGGYYHVIGASVLAAGSGYSSLTAIALSGGNPTTNAVLSPTVVGGSLASVTSLSSGNYQFATVTPTVTDPGYYYVSSVSIISAGSEYGPNAAITASGGGAPQSQAILSPLLSGGETGSLASVTIDSGGVYGTNTVPTVVVTDSTTTAAGVVNLMPLGVQGNAAETYQGSVWVYDGPTVNFTAPGSVFNFATSAGGGSFKSADSYLKIGFVQGVSTNGFLFNIGDNSMNYISGVSTSGTPPTTTFTNNNSDPEVGTPYPAAITTLGQDILMANSTGIFVSSGGAFVKKSEPLDGIYNTVSNFAGLQLSAAKATIFGKRVWMVLAPIVDPVTGTPPQNTNAGASVGSVTLNFGSTLSQSLVGQLAYDVTNPNAITSGTTVASVSGVSNSTVTLSASVSSVVDSGDQVVFFKQKLLMWNGKWWWASLQDVPLTFISGQEIGSVYTAWGTDGTHIYPLFQNPSGFTKIAQSRLWDVNGYEFNKTVSRFWSIWQCYNTAQVNFTVDLDAVGIDGSGNQFTNTQSYPITGPTSAGFFVTPTQAVGQQGVLFGMTFVTTAYDMALISAEILPDPNYNYRG